MSPSGPMETTVHRPRRLLVGDIERVFAGELKEYYKEHVAPGVDFDEAAYLSYLGENLLAIPTWQPSELDLSVSAGLPWQSLTFWPSLCGSP